MMDHPFQHITSSLLLAKHLQEEHHHDMPQTYVPPLREMQEVHHREHENAVTIPSVLTDTRTAVMMMREQHEHGMDVSEQALELLVHTIDTAEEMHQMLEEAREMLRTAMEALGGITASREM